MHNSSLDMQDFLEIFNSLSDAVVVYDSKLRVIFANEKLYEYAGFDFDKKSLLGTTPEQHLKDGLIFNTIVQQVLDNKSETSGMIRSRTGYYSSRCRPVFDKDGNVQYIVSTASSINEISALKDMLHRQAAKNELYLREVEQLRKAMLTDKYIFVSKHMEELSETIKKVAPIDCNVLITGESGVGKDVVAQLIHMNSQRRSGPYFPVNIPAIPENLLEAELFGYEEGAFTGSVKGGKLGLLEAAKGGTVLLDEIGDMPWNMQVKILRAIESGEVMRLGATKPVKLDVRLLAATNKDIHEALVRGSFRSDLYYRLNVVTIHVNPLRERLEDILPLCQYFLSQFNDKYGQQKRFDISALTEMEVYTWPGNIRELKNTVERLCILSEGNSISSHDVKQLLDMKSPKAQNINIDSGVSSREERFSNLEMNDRSVQRVFDEYTRQQVFDALKRTNGNKTAAAGLLGISRGKLYRLLREL